MESKTTGKKAEKITRKEFSLRGSAVVIIREGDRETLQINGRLVDFYHTVDGYLLKLDVFQKPAKTLREAVERYLEHEAAP